MTSYEDPNQTPTDAMGARASGHSDAVGWAAAPVSDRVDPASTGFSYPPRPAGFLPASAMASAPHPPGGQIGPGDPTALQTPAHQAMQPRRGGRRLVVAGVAALVLAAGGGFAGAAAMHAVDGTSPTASTGGTSVQTVASAGSIADVVATVDQEVVSITVRGDQQADEGSGVVVGSNGLILTNNHVIAAAANGGSVQVTFTNGKTVPASIVKADASEDLALVQAQGVSGLHAATFGNSDSLQIGDTVIAIGNELGLPNSVSAGIVSALHRKVSVAGEDTGGGFGRSAAQSNGTTYNDAIQTDASTNQGDSGGALFNMAGQVVGINSAIATASNGDTGSVGIGFAISSNDAATFVAGAGNA